MSYDIGNLLAADQYKKVVKIKGWENIEMRPISHKTESMCKAQAYRLVSETEEFKKACEAFDAFGKDEGNSKKAMNANFFWNTFNIALINEQKLLILFNGCFKEGTSERYFDSADTLRNLPTGILSPMIHEYDEVFSYSPLMSEISENDFNNIYEDFKKKQTSGIFYSSGTLMSFCTKLVEQAEEAKTKKEKKQ